MHEKLRDSSENAAIAQDSYDRNLFDQLKRILRPAFCTHRHNFSSDSTRSTAIYVQMCCK